MDPLDHLKPVSGCSMDWKQMTGDEKARHCAQCSKTVHHLSAMKKSEARTLLASGGGKLCITFSLDARGHLVSKPETTWFTRCANWFRGGVAFATGLVLAGCATTTPPSPSPPSAPCATSSGKELDSKMYMGDEGIFFVESPQIPPEKQGTKHPSR